MTFFSPFTCCGLSFLRLVNFFLLLIYFPSNSTFFPSLILKCFKQSHDLLTGSLFIRTLLFFSMLFRLKGSFKERIWKSKEYTKDPTRNKESCFNHGTHRNQEYATIETGREARSTPFCPLVILRGIHLHLRCPFSYFLRFNIHNLFSISQNTLISYKTTVHSSFKLYAKAFICMLCFWPCCPVLLSKTSPFHRCEQNLGGLPEVKKVWIHL